MKPIRIEDALHQAPFRPFDLFLDNGLRFHVAHPECLVFNASKTACIVVEGDHFRILDVNHLSGLTFQHNGDAEGKPKG